MAAMDASTYKVNLGPYLAVEASAPLPVASKHWQCLAKGDWDREKKEMCAYLIDQRCEPWLTPV